MNECFFFLCLNMWLLNLFCMSTIWIFSIQIMSMVEMKSDSFFLTIVFFNFPLIILVTVLH